MIGRRRTKSGVGDSKGHRKSQQAQKRHPVPSDIDYPANPVPDLPPNEIIRKHPDEVYGDTEIPHRPRRHKTKL